jgi:hypothetical protein
MPASMCEDVVRDYNLEHLAIGGDIQLHFRPSTESVTTRLCFRRARVNLDVPWPTVILMQET